jgi:LEA14-like dessication related protein
MMIQHSLIKTAPAKHAIFRLTIVSLFLFALEGCKPKEDVVLRKITNIVLDVTTEPVLQANAVLYNPNNMRMTIKRLDIEIFVDGKKAAVIDQKLKTRVPAKSEFTVPLEARLNLKELGFLDTVFAVLGGKKMKIRYKGAIRFTYKGVPIRVPVDYQDEIRVRI